MKIDLEQILLDKAVLIGKPLKATLELTPTCNFNCEMCYIRQSNTDVEAKGGLLPYSFWDSVIEQLKELGVLVVCLIGGEPFLYPQIEQVYSKLVANGFLVNITTNGSLLANGVPDWMLSSPPRYITVSLYGASNDTYKKVTGHSNGYSMAIKGIENLLNAGIDVKLNFLVTPGNKNDLEKIIEMKNQYNLPLLATSYSHPVNRREDRESQNRLTAIECAEYDMKIHQLLAPEQYLEYCKKLVSNDDSVQPSPYGESVSCYAGKGAFWIDWQGNIIPCSMLSYVAVSLKDMKLADAWDVIREQIPKIRTSKKCAECKYRKICRVCAGSMYIETGDTSSCPEYLCTVTDEMIRIANAVIEADANKSGLIR